MSVRVLDLTDDFLAFWRAARSAPRPAKRERWERHYRARHDGVLGAPLARHRFDGDLDRALARFDDLAAILPARRDHVLTQVEPTVREVCRVLDAPVPAVDIVLLVGLFGADGWVDEVDGRPTIHIALESLESDGQARCLLAHEVAHLVHFDLLGDDPMETVGDALFEEGLAVAVTRHVEPSLSDAQLLNIGRTTTAGGIPADEWLAHCAAVPAWREAVLTGFAAEDDEAYARLFLGGDPATGRPTRFGYVAGYRAVRAMERRAVIADIARWPRPTANSALRSWLASGASGG